MKDKEKKFYRNISDAVMGQPKTCDELIHKYGTYEIQPTNDSDNEFPEIAQALPKQDEEKELDKYWKKRTK